MSETSLIWNVVSWYKRIVRVVVDAKVVDRDVEASKPRRNICWSRPSGSLEDLGWPGYASQKVKPSLIAQLVVQQLVLLGGRYKSHQRKLLYKIASQHGVTT